MKKKGRYILVSLCFILIATMTGLGQKYILEIVMVEDSGLVQPSDAPETATVSGQNPETEQAQNPFDEEVQNLWEQIKDEPDPAECERLQKEIIQVKGNCEIARLEQSLVMAVERGDDDLTAEIEEELVRLQLPEVSKACDSETRQPPEEVTAASRVRKINPDDQQGEEVEP
ncbi:MAG: hypothetical protein JXD22_05450 [Sedimentisphaerales bacterium]|nr:hypothetical protein [Sedimentisphaerales bacterium]